MKNMFRLIAFALTVVPFLSLANNATLTNLTLTGVTATTADIEFDLSWENSWRLSWSDDGGATTVENWDAVWVFAKYREQGGSWKHAWLSSSGHTATGGSVIDIASNGGITNVGAFVYRSATGSGTMNCSNMRLRWNMAANGLSGTDNIDLSVHAIEMVYIPQGAFHLGSGGSESIHFYTYPDIGTTYYLTSEDAINAPTPGATDRYPEYKGALDYPYAPLIIPQIYPKGYFSFYCMKYEVSQGQYASFLSYLDPSQASVRYPAFYGSSRYTIHLGGNGKYIADAPDRACNYLGWADLSAYLDWACLRPMTEFEFEKACRGTHLPEPDEYAWGDTTRVALTNFFGTDGSGAETALPEEANCAGSSSSKYPARVGIFARQGSTRHDGGATYYGVMEMTGNVEEWVVNSYRAEGVAFIPKNGDGSLLTGIADWPTYSGMGWRGGYGEGSAVSDRGRIDDAVSGRVSTGGGRGVRSEP